MNTTFFAVGNVAEHSGFVTSRRGPAFPADGGWTEQDVTGAHGDILAECETEEEAQRVLAEWERCDAAAEGRYCYAHNPGAHDRLT